MVSTIVNNNTARISIRKALTYSGCSKNIYYGNKDHRYDITAATAATAVTPSSSSTTTIIEKRDTTNFHAKTNLWYQKNGCNAYKNSWNTC